MTFGDFHQLHTRYIQGVVCIKWVVNDVIYKGCCLLYFHISIFSINTILIFHELGCYIIVSIQLYILQKRETPTLYKIEFNKSRIFIEMEME